MIRKIDLRFAPGVLPTVYEDTLSFYELIKKMGFTVNQLIDRVDSAEETAVIEKLKELLVNVTYNAETETAIISFDDDEPVLTDEVITKMQIAGKIYPVKDEEATERINDLTERVDSLKPGTPCIYHSIGPNMAHPAPSGVTVHYTIYVGKVLPNTDVSDDFPYSDELHAYATLERAFQDWDEHTNNCYIAVYGNRNANGTFIPTNYYINRRTFSGGQLHLKVHSEDVKIYWGTDSSNFDHLFYNMYLHITGYKADENPTVNTEIIYKGHKQGWYLEGCSLTSAWVNWKDDSVNHDVSLGIVKSFADFGNCKFSLPFYSHHSQIFVGQNTTFAPEHDVDDYAVVFSKSSTVMFDRDATANKPILFTMPDNYALLKSALTFVECRAYIIGTYLKFENTSDKTNIYGRYADIITTDADVERLKSALGNPNLASCYLNGNILDSNDFVVGTSVATSVAVNDTINRPSEPFITCIVTGSDNRNYRIPCFIGGGQTGIYYATTPMVNSTTVISIGYKISKSSIQFEMIKEGNTDKTIARIITS